MTHNVLRWIPVLVALGLATAAAPAAADDVVGASGQCFDADGNGGQDEVRVGDDGSVVAPTVTGAAAALTEFAEGNAADPADPCPNPDGDNEETVDYLEAHVAGVQVCYKTNQFFVGGCPTSPSGPA